VPSDTRYCLRASSGNRYVYYSPSPYTTYTLDVISDNGTRYRVTNDTKPEVASSGINASQGPAVPGTATVVAASGGTRNWGTPANVSASDDVYSVASNSFSPAKTNYLKVTNFGFTVPSNAIINGIMFEVEKNEAWSAGSHATDNEVKVVKSDGSIGTQNNAITSPTWSSVDTYSQYGSSSDLWGETWTAADVNSSNFGMVLSANISQFMFLSIDHVRATVYFTLP
jgi:hypothetical protein